MLPEEVLLKTWNVTRNGLLDNDQRAGYVHLTDVRLVFTGYLDRTFSKTRTVQEIHIHDINGITAYVRRGPTSGLVWLIAAWTLAFGVLGIGLGNWLTTYIPLPLIYHRWEPIGNIAMFLVLAYLLVRAITAGSLGFGVHTRTSQGTPVIFGDGPDQGGFKEIVRIYTRPTREARTMIADVGARIRDVQINGNTRQANPEGPWAATR